MKDRQDAYGHEVYDYLQSKKSFEVIERDDGYVDVSLGAANYFQEYKDWPAHQKKAMKYVRGKVLDIGCGAGRHALYLQSKRFDVMGIDQSPLALKVCKLRGLKKTQWVPIEKISAKLGRFDTILMQGNNLGLFGNFEKAHRLLKRLRIITNEHARIVAESRDPYKTDNPFHLSYHRWNRKRSRMSGQIKMRVRYKKYISPWFDYLMVSREEMKKILTGTGWRVKKFIGGKDGMYNAIIEKE
ncbi:class I SAM-dependent methyltransferase [Candidatus Acetothermia bacterium]|nr:class I SAM-dependent methyltransferase [Candidatus Acetothermia bacterium]